MFDGRSIEIWYQCDIKQYDPGGTNCQLGKGKPPLAATDLAEAYLALWRVWAQRNFPLMRELFRGVRSQGDGCTLSDCFASTPVNQTWALAQVLNELSGFEH
jgi:hypothetical protein